MSLRAHLLHQMKCQLLFSSSAIKLLKSWLRETNLMQQIWTLSSSWVQLSQSSRQTSTNSHSPAMIVQCKMPKRLSSCISINLKKRDRCLKCLMTYLLRSNLMSMHNLKPTQSFHPYLRVILWTLRREDLLLIQDTWEPSLTSGRDTTNKLLRTDRLEGELLYH